MSMTVNKGYKSGMLTEAGKQYRKNQIGCSAFGGIAGALATAGGITVFILMILTALHSDPTSLNSAGAIKGFAAGLYWGSALTIGGTVLATLSLRHLGKLNHPLNEEKKQKFIMGTIQ